MVAKKKYNAYYEKNNNASSKGVAKVVTNDRFKAQEYLRKKLKNDTIIVYCIEPRIE